MRGDCSKSTRCCNPLLAVKKKARHAMPGLLIDGILLTGNFYHHAAVRRQAINQRIAALTVTL